MKRIGPYRIVRLLAEGGMGAVYLAEREDHFKQRVALKMIRPEKSDDVLERFYEERQILAGLEHPRIARIFDGGTAEDGLPFFVMEYVEGRPLDEACRDLSLTDRLKLFSEVCEAVQYAHQKLVVHRDLKPSNILVGEDGKPKLLDFGIAKILRSESGDEDRARPAASPQLTLAYASPEQICRDPVSTATDVYSLGVLFYETLCGRHPYFEPDGEHGPLVYAICAQDPEPPSRRADPATARRLSGDLDAIVLKALQKDPADRYGSVAEMMEEIRRHLEDLPVKAYPGSWRHQARKKVRRHKLASVVAGSILALTVTVTGLWLHAEDQRVQAERARIQAERTKDFLLDFFRSVEPDQNPGREVDLQKVLDQGRRKLEDSLREEPEIRAELSGALGVVYSALALHDEALEMYAEALSARRAANPRAHRELANDLNNLATAHYGQGDLPRAEEIFREALSMWDDLGESSEVLTVLSNLAATLHLQGETDEALGLYQQALALAQEEPESLRVAGIYYGLGAIRRRGGDLPQAREDLEKALRIYTEHADAKPSRIAQVRSSLGQVLHRLGELQEAHALLRSALDERRRLFGEDHPQVIGSRRVLALLLIDLGEHEEAEQLLTQALERARSSQDERRMRQILEAQERLEEAAAVRLATAD